MAKFPSTTPGYENRNGQRVIASTGFPSETFPGQTVYRMRCVHCQHEYGSNGCDIHLRRCPRHQDGTRGERLREAAPSLFAAATG